jgi:hypothetical protein
MSTEHAILPAIERLLVLSVETTLVKAVTGVPQGDRMIFDVVSGTFEGPRLSGRVLPSGGDWVTRTPTGSRMNVRLVLETHDAAIILFQYSGRTSQDDGRLRIEAAGTFDAPEGAYGWLNDVQTFGRGAVGPDGVCYHFYRFK